MLRVVSPFRGVFWGSWAWFFGVFVVGGFGGGWLCFCLVGGVWGGVVVFWVFRWRLSGCLTLPLKNLVSPVSFLDVKLSSCVGVLRGPS